MKKRVIGLLLLGILLFSPLVLSQEQDQTYSGFDRFIDNVKILFFFGDKRVMLTLDIREKELNSAIINTKNGDNEEAEKNLERAKERLQYVQNKVSKDIAEDVIINIDKTINKINAEESLPDNFETYILEEEKTQLTAELVIEIEGKEGQTLTREIVKDGGSGKNKVEIIVGEDGSRQNKVGVVEGEIEGQIQEQTRTREIEEKIDEIDEQIAEGTNVIEGGINVVESGINVVESGMDTDDLDKRDPDATPLSPAGDVDDTVDPGPQGIVGSDHE